MKNTKILYWISIGVLSFLMVLSAILYLYKHEQTTEYFQALSFPTYIITPLAIAKIAGIFIIVQRKNRKLVEWAYAGFFYLFIIALSAHIVSGHGSLLGPLLTLLLLFTAYYFGKKIYG